VAPKLSVANEVVWEMYVCVNPFNTADSPLFSAGLYFGHPRHGAADSDSNTMTISTIGHYSIHLASNVQHIFKALFLLLFTFMPVLF
jgi:hypothetical protein